MRCGREKRRRRKNVMRQKKPWNRFRWQKAPTVCFSVFSDGDAVWLAKGKAKNPSPSASHFLCSLFSREKTVTWEQNDGWEEALSAPNSTSWLIGYRVNTYHFTLRTQVSFQQQTPPFHSWWILSTRSLTTILSSKPWTQQTVLWSTLPGLMISRRYNFSCLIQKVSRWMAFVHSSFSHFAHSYLSTDMLDPANRNPGKFFPLVSVFQNLCSTIDFSEFYLTT